MYETLITMVGTKPYKGEDIARDIGIPEATFRETWNPSEADRTYGRTTFKAVIEQALKVNDRYSPQLFQRILENRKVFEKEVFNHLHPQVLPMLEQLRERGVKVALISNCYLEERDNIRTSILLPYFDVACLSCELGMKKPQPEIFHCCLEKLQLTADQCLYIGDGGSHELEAAQQVGMHPLQAAWYLQEGADQPCGRKPEFTQLESPLDVLNYL